MFGAPTMGMNTTAIAEKTGTAAPEAGAAAAGERRLTDCKKSGGRSSKSSYGDLFQGAAPAAPFTLKPEMYFIVSAFERNRTDSFGHSGILRR